MDLFEFSQGSLPLLVSMPHSGTHIPPELAARMTEEGLAVPDTDWHIPRLYDFLGDLDVSVIRATHSRYVADLNRAPDGAALYAGADNTELCPISTFGRRPIYRDGQAPAEAEVAQRRSDYWQPYHDRIAAALATMKERHGIALLWDAHSIRSEVPRFFEGRLPDLNLGTAEGAAAAPDLLGILTAVAREAEAIGYSHAANGRFKGGYITRQYGKPDAGIHAVQLELSWITYMDEDPPFAFREDLAAKVRPVLSGLVQTMLAWAEMEVDL
ncbi:N-formylglutamate deformylase [Pelagibius litoralis]|uniref:N-formylglutamate deformylase n=1 Tax=Pelagibius litoralis TaxID=374515 RepID=A0A967EVP2_9PROT|nr:N-formylglutamate deformylase [Pelagibius litoralis]NIA68961.1 N-formylglutamate deformylase [Pelagibius litoralis]